MVANAGAEGVGILLRGAFDAAVNGETRPARVFQRGAEVVCIRLADGGTQQEVPARGAIRQAQVQGVFAAVISPAGERVKIRGDEGELAHGMHQYIICLLHARAQVGEHELAFRGGAEGELGVLGAKVPVRRMSGFHCRVSYHAVYAFSSALSQAH